MTLDFVNKLDDLLEGYWTLAPEKRQEILDLPVMLNDMIDRYIYGGNYGG
jgi:hypothetical protein